MADDILTGPDGIELAPMGDAADVTEKDAPWKDIFGDFVGRAFWDVNDAQNGRGIWIEEIEIFGTDATWTPNGQFVKIKHKSTVLQVGEGACEAMAGIVGKWESLECIYEADLNTMTFLQIGTWTIWDETTRSWSDGRRPDGPLVERFGWKYHELYNPKKAAQVMLRNDGKTLVQFDIAWEGEDPTAGMGIFFRRPSSSELHPLCPVCVEKVEDNTTDIIKECQNYLNVDTKFMAPGEIPEVQIRAKFQKLISADTIEQQFSAFFVYTMTWPVTRLDIVAYVTLGEDEKHKWKPAFILPPMEVTNLVGGEISHPELEAIPCVLIREDDSIVAQQEIRICGDFYENFELKNFPYDVQQLSISLKLAVGSTYQKVKLDVQVMSGSEDVAINSTEWVPAIEGNPTSVELSEDGFVVRLTLKREYMAHFWRISLIMGLCSFIALTGFVLDPVEDVADRLGLTITVLLAVAVYSLVVSGHLPQLGYLTLLDTQILGVMLYAVCVMFQFTVLGKIEHDDIDDINDWAFYINIFTVVVGNLAFALYIIYWVIPFERLKATSSLSQTVPPAEVEEKPPGGEAIPDETTVEPIPEQKNTTATKREPKRTLVV